jgi:hypothetical protein
VFVLLKLPLTVQLPLTIMCQMLYGLRRR